MPTVQIRVVGHEKCPRCEAKGKVRAIPAFDIPVSKLLRLEFNCPKCRLIEPRGVASTELVMYIDQEEKLLKLLRHETHPRLEAKLRARLQDVREKKRLARLAIPT